MTAEARAIMKQQKSRQTENSKKRQFCTFFLFNRMFGVDILTVKEISTEVNMTTIYHAPDEVQGYVNIRGQIYLVIDLRLLLGHEKGEVTPDTRIILFKNEVGDSFGVLVDKISDVIEVNDSQIDEYQKWNEGNDSALTARMAKLTDGVCRLEDNLLVVLNPRLFLSEMQKLVA